MTLFWINEKVTKQNLHMHLFFCLFVQLLLLIWRSASGKSVEIVELWKCAAQIGDSALMTVAMALLLCVESIKPPIRFITIGVIDGVLQSVDDVDAA